VDPGHEARDDKRETLLTSGLGSRLRGYDVSCEVGVRARNVMSGEPGISATPCSAPPMLAWIPAFAGRTFLVKEARPSLHKAR
jgi:hypothetical protein